MDYIKIKKGHYMWPFLLISLELHPLTIFFKTNHNGHTSFMNKLVS